MKTKTVALFSIVLLVFGVASVIPVAFSQGVHDIAVTDIFVPSEVCQG